MERSCLYLPIRLKVMQCNQHRAVEGKPWSRAYSIHVYHLHRYKIQSWWSTVDKEKSMTPKGCSTSHKSSWWKMNELPLEFGIYWSVSQPASTEGGEWSPKCFCCMNSEIRISVGSIPEQYRVVEFNSGRYIYVPLLNTNHTIKGNLPGWGVTHLSIRSAQDKSS